MMNIDYSKIDPRASFKSNKIEEGEVAGKKSLPTLSDWDKTVRIRGSIIGGVVLGGAIGSIWGLVFTIVGGLLGVGIGLAIALSDARRRGRHK